MKYLLILFTFYFAIQHSKSNDQSEQAVQNNKKWKEFDSMWMHCGVPLKMSQPSDLEVCKMQCLQSPNCNSVNFNKDEKLCHSLQCKFSMGELDQIVKKWKDLENIWAHCGVPLEMSQPTDLEGCQRQCMMDKNCNAMNFNEYERLCYSLQCNSTVPQPQVEDPSLGKRVRLEDVAWAKSPGHGGARTFVIQDEVEYNGGNGSAEIVKRKIRNFLPSNQQPEENRSTDETENDFWKGFWKWIYKTNAWIFHRELTGLNSNPKERLTNAHQQ